MPCTLMELRTSRKSLRRAFPDSLMRLKVKATKLRTLPTKCSDTSTKPTSSTDLAISTLAVEDTVAGGVGGGRTEVNEDLPEQQREGPQNVKLQHAQIRQQKPDNLAVPAWGVSGRCR